MQRVSHMKGPKVSMHSKGSPYTDEALSGLLQLKPGQLSKLSSQSPPVGAALLLAVNEE